MLNLGQEQTVKTSERAWRLSRLEIPILHGFRDYIAEKIGDPFARAEKVIKMLPASEARARILEAEAVQDQLEGFSLTCPLAQRFMKTEEGMSRLVRLLLLKHQPEATDNDGLQILLQIGMEEAAKVVQNAEGRLPNGHAPAAKQPRASTGTTSTSS